MPFVAAPHLSLRPPAPSDAAHRRPPPRPPSLPAAAAAAHARPRAPQAQLGEAKNEKNKAPTKAKKKDCAAGVANEARPHPPCLPSSLPSASLCRARLHRTSLSSRPVPRRRRRPLLPASTLLPLSFQHAPHSPSRRATRMTS